MLLFGLTIALTNIRESRIFEGSKKYFSIEGYNCTMLFKRYFDLAKVNEFSCNAGLIDSNFFKSVSNICKIEFSYTFGIKDVM